VLQWAWRASEQVDPSLRIRSKFVIAALRDPALCRRLQDAGADSPFGALLAEWPQTVGALIWPYQCADWNAEKRFQRIAAHTEAVSRVPGLTLSPDDKLVLADLSAVSPGISVIIDRPPWLSREGHLTLSLFKDEFRAFTLSFSLFGHPDPELFVGGLQGRQTDDILSIYRDITKDFAGVRPRDFMLEMLRFFAVNIGAKRIDAVADDHKITRHAYFRGKAAPGLFYDDVWLERGGVRVADSHFQLPLEPQRRDLSAIAAKKRSMYRRRYEMLDEIMAAIPRELTQAKRVQFDAQ
jgi:uncharacterized protein VirK/YbjX